MFYQVKEGVDCFEVGIQQLLDFMGWKSNVRDDGWNTNGSLDWTICSVYRDDYVVVRVTCEFGRISRPCVCSVFRSFDNALNHASALTYVENECMACRSRDFDMYFTYEVWHVMDDGDLWQAWDYDSEFSRVDSPVLLDERDIDDDEVDHVQLYSLCIPGAGPVSFLWFLRRGELVEEYFNSDWYGWQPRRLADVGWFNWSIVDDLLACFEMLESLTRAVEWALTYR